VGAPEASFVLIAFKKYLKIICIRLFKAGSSDKGIVAGFKIVVSVTSFASFRFFSVFGRLSPREVIYGEG
jgi:hypothetical protein